MRLADHSPYFFVCAAAILILGLACGLGLLALALARPAARRPALLLTAVGLALVPPLLALPLAVHPLRAAMALWDGLGIVLQTPLLEGTRLLIAGCAVSLAGLAAFAATLVPALRTSPARSAEAATGSRPAGLAAGAALVVALVGLGVFEYTRDGLNLIRYVSVTARGTNPALLEEARRHHAELRDDPEHPAGGIAVIATAMTRAVAVGAIGGAIALLAAAVSVPAGLQLAGRAGGRAQLARVALLGVLGLATANAFWIWRLGLEERALYATLAPLLGG